MSGDRFFDDIGHLDTLLARRDIAAALEEVSRRHTDLTFQMYFFQHLDDPMWLEPLRLGGFFRAPRGAERDPVRGTISFPIWPAGDYLARMAKIVDAQRLVLEIALEIPETDNVRVHDSLADLALALPAPLAVQLVPKAKKWIESPYQILLPEKLGALVGYLASQGHVDAALNLARTLLAVLPDPRARDLHPDPGMQLTPEPAAHFDVWHYEQVLKKRLDALVDAAGLGAVTLFCDLLESAVELSRQGAADDVNDDYSWIWRPAIEEHEQNRRETVKTLLVSAVRDAVERVGAREPGTVGELVLLLEQRRWRIFHRIALHLLRRYPEHAKSIVEQRFTNRELFDDLVVRHEYVLLVVAAFAIVSEPARQSFLAWIEQGPDLEGVRARYREDRNVDLSDDDLSRYAKIWQRDHLAPLRNVLPDLWRSRYAELVSEVGDAEHPEFSAYIGTGWVGPTSPESATDLRPKSVVEIVEYLRSWAPSSQEWMSPSREGLGRELTSIVQAEPQRFSGNARLFIGSHPTYVRALVTGLRDAAKEGRALDWPPVIELCYWVVRQPLQTSESPPRRDEDPGWNWTRKSIASLLSAAFVKGDAQLAFPLRDRAWAVLRPLTDDPEPTREYEAQFGGTNMDPATLSINTTRGEAMHAVVQYALWVRRQSEQVPDSAAILASGLDAMPEVRQVLEAHIDPSNDPSLAIRAVYGQWFPWLVLLDREWAAEHVSRIFPGNQEASAWRDAAWDTYITFCRPYDNVFDVLRGEYAKAIERLGTVRAGRHALGDPDEQLAEHLVLFYGRGRLGLAPQTELLGRFFEKASVRIRARAIEFVGRSLRDDKGSIPRAVLDRFVALWNERLQYARLMPNGSSEELAKFGWWFVSEKFDDNWSMEQLEEALTLAKSADPAHAIAERLAEVAERMPRQAVRCLSALAEADREGWAIVGWEAQARKILSIGMQSSDSEAREAATNLIHRLGARGRLGFRDLLA